MSDHDDLIAVAKRWERLYNETVVRNDLLRSERDLRVDEVERLRAALREVAQSWTALWVAQSEDDMYDTNTRFDAAIEAAATLSESE